MKRNYNLDLIRIAACVAVLVLHIFGVEGGKNIEHGVEKNKIIFTLAKW